jgi:formate C-acetyltransferase
MAEDEAVGELTPTPFQSTLVADCIEKGLDTTRGGARYNKILCANTGIVTGLVNEANSLAVIKKLIFEDKAITWDDLLNALAANWEDYEDLRLMVTNRVPKFGNDDDYVDSIMQELLKLNGSRALDYKTPTRKAVFGSEVASASGNVLAGKFTDATPDGRFAGTPVADGGISPHMGTDVNGPTAIMNSICKLNHPDSIEGTLWNIKFSKQALEEDKGVDNLANWLRAYVDKGGYHVQINCLDNKTLREAQEQPEKHRNLLVRIAGYSAFFTELDEDCQDMLIARTEHEGL